MTSHLVKVRGRGRGRVRDRVGTTITLLHDEPPQLFLLDPALLLVGEVPSTIRALLLLLLLLVKGGGWSQDECQG
tara:strand:- start:180 stop:404 length:225 start_codon:yes stop_codon:yes gene_type:complete